MPDPMPRTILHVDMDAFFAAVEEREDPSLAGRPVVVGSDPREGKGRGVVATANYEARKFGVHSAMPISRAWRLCPHAAYVRPQGRVYSEVSRTVYEVFDRFTDLVEPVGIDEAFLDVTASRRLFGDGPAISVQVKDAIRDATGLTASIGCAESKFVAKIASDLDKPDGLVVVPPGESAAFLAPLPIRRLWGAGPRAIERLRRLGCTTIGDVAALDPRVLERSFGEALARRFHRLANGQDSRPVRRGRERKSLGKETTFGSDVASRATVERVLLGLCEDVAAACRRKGLAACTVTVKLRFGDFETTTRQCGLPQGADTVESLWPAARRMFRAADQPGRRIRLVGVTASNLLRSGDDAPARQLGMFDAARSETDRRVAAAVDRLREKYGRDSVRRAILLPDADDTTTTKRRTEPQ